VLDARNGCACITPMKTKIYFLLALTVMTAGVVGCINTVSGRKTAAVPWKRDRVEGRYERTLEQVFAAAREVMLANGTINIDGELHNTVNPARFIEAKVKQCNVWVRVEQIAPGVTSVVVQTRTTKGGTNLELAIELEKEVALKLAR
jgi:hypothetical protein